MNISFLAGIAVGAIALYVHNEYKESKDAETVVYKSPCFDDTGNLKSFEEIMNEHKKYSCKVIWNNILNIVRENVTALTFETWIKPLQPVCVDEENKFIVVETSNDCVWQIVNERHQNLLDKSVERVMGKEYRVKVKYNA